MLSLPRHSLRSPEGLTRGWLQRAGRAGGSVVDGVREEGGVGAAVEGRRKRKGKEVEVEDKNDGGKNGGGGVRGWRDEGQVVEGGRGGQGEEKEEDCGKTSSNATRQVELDTSKAAREQVLRANADVC